MNKCWNKKNKLKNNRSYYYNTLVCYNKNQIITNKR